MKRTQPMARTGILRSASFNAEPKRRTRKCALATCRQPFEPRTATHVCCSIECALAHVDERKAKKDRAETRGRLAALKSRADHLKDAQAAVNAFIRARDDDLPCISCGRHHEGQYHAGHFLSRGAHPALRFHEWNLAKQCQPCNVQLSGNALNYRRGLIERIGLTAVEWLEGPHEAKKYSIADALAIKAEYKKKLRGLKT